MQRQQHRPKQRKPAGRAFRALARVKRKLVKRLSHGNPFDSLRSRHSQRSWWLASHSRSKYTPHQGEQEKARRRRQMAAHTHGY